MIVDPNLESTLTYFANYKRNIGYDVKVVNTNTTGRTATEIQNYLEQEFNTNRPTFVLLVGDDPSIPGSHGSHSGYNVENPMTDLHYAMLDDQDGLRAYYNPDVLLGRFSVNTNAKLRNIIHKTIWCC